MILLIDTSQETGSVALAKEGRVLFSEENRIPKEHTGWLHLAINRVLDLAKISLRELEAVAVVAGPGSYTGLRVGMAAAKGFCYALKIPLITLNSLRVMAESMIEKAVAKNAMICPLIDARRNEVFTALYQISSGLHPTDAIPLVEVLPPQALIFDKNSFEDTLSHHSVIFFGSGASKWQEICPSPNAHFIGQTNTVQAFAKLAQLEFTLKNWADPVYAEPVYLKEFFTY